jgi:glycerophosphoryl diester phosphodiesterase
MTEIIAHRGASRDHEENTLPAFSTALEQGADGLELDVHATRDGTIVVHHDPAVRSHGNSSLHRISELTAAEVAAVQLPGGGRVPTLDDVLTLVGTRATVYAEVKANGIEVPLVECLRRHQGAHVAIHAFDHRIPVAVRAMLPGISIGFLSSSYPLDLPALLRAARPQALWQHADLIDASLVAEAHAMNARVIAWTENDLVHALALTGLGVDALCTDIPGPLRAGMSRPGLEVLGC